MTEHLKSLRSLLIKAGIDERQFSDLEHCPLEHVDSILASSKCANDPIIRMMIRSRISLIQFEAGKQIKEERKRNLISIIAGLLLAAAIIALFFERILF